MTLIFISPDRLWSTSLGKIFPSPWRPRNTTTRSLHYPSSTRFHDENAQAITSPCCPPLTHASRKHKISITITTWLALGINKFLLSTTTTSTIVGATLKFKIDESSYIVLYIHAVVSAWQVVKQAGVWGAGLSTRWILSGHLLLPLPRRWLFLTWSRHPPPLSPLSRHCPQPCNNTAFAFHDQQNMRTKHKHHPRSSITIFAYMFS